MAKWHKFTKDTMPPVNNGEWFLICRGYREPGGGVMSTAKRVQYDGDEPYIRYIGWVGGDSKFDWVILEPEEYRKCLWQEIEYPCDGLKRINTTIGKLMRTESPSIR